MLFDELQLVDKPKKTRTGNTPPTSKSSPASLPNTRSSPTCCTTGNSPNSKAPTSTPCPTRSTPSAAVHTHYGQVHTATGRLSSNDPNLQNIPVRSSLGREIRKAFVPRAGWQLLAADYSQIELRILAALTADEGLLTAFREGQDIHTATAAKLFDQPLRQSTATSAALPRW